MSTISTTSRSACRPPRRRRRGHRLPILTAIVPVVGALVLWRITGSVHFLWFAALGPLVAGASFVDGLRTARRARRRAGREDLRALAHLEEAVARRHEAGVAVRGGVPRRGDAVRRRGRGVALGART
jgi:hypothetical protein